MSTERPVRIVVFGASGRMGRSVIDVIANGAGTMLAGSVRRGSRGELEFMDAGGQAVESQALLAQADAAIDFTLPEAVNAHVALCSEHDLPYVCGVTGLGEHTLAILAQMARQQAVLWAPNMSTSVTICFGAAADIAARLDAGFTVSIADIHHEGKKDAPSGTALEFGRVIQAASAGEVEISYSSVREGSHPGEHHIVFRSANDVIELRHCAGSRSEFAAGAVRAAQWIAEQPPGLYNMRNVLGITSSS